MSLNTMRALWVSLLVSTAAPSAEALTPIDSAFLSSDIAVDFGVGSASRRSLVHEALAGPSSIEDFPDLPASVALAAYSHTEAGADLLVLDTTVSLPGGVVASPRTVLRHEAGVYSVEWDGNSAGLPAGVRIDALAWTNGAPLLSVDTGFLADGGMVGDEDLITPLAGGFTIVFDGSAAGLAPGLDLDGAHLFPATGNLALSFDRAGHVGGIDFDDEDVLEHDPLGGTWEMAWDADVERPGWPASADASAVHFVPEPTPLVSLPAGAALLAWLHRRRSAR